MSSIQSQPSLDTTLGALQVSLPISLALFGASSIQFYYYLEHQRGDDIRLKSFVIFVWVLELAHAIVFLHAVYCMNISGFGSHDFYLKDTPGSLKLLVLFSAILDIVVEGYFAYRIKVLSKRWEVPLLCWLLIAIRIGAAICQTVLSFNKGFIKSIHNQVYVVVILIAPLAIVDFLISASLPYWLSRIRSGLPSSDEVINRLSVFALECGLLTFLLGACILVTALTMRNNFIWLGILCVHSKVYSNALLLSLNRRESMANAFGTDGQDLTRISASGNPRYHADGNKSAIRRGYVQQDAKNDYPTGVINIISRPNMGLKLDREVNSQVEDSPSITEEASADSDLRKVLL